MTKVQEMIEAAERELTASEMRLLAERLVVRADLQVEPTHRIVADRNMRPKYLAGTTGTVGGRRGRRREFFPTAGTKAYYRGRSWKVTETSLEEIV